MASCIINRVVGAMYTKSPPLTGAYPENDADAAERTSSKKVNRLRPSAFPHSQGFKNTPVARDRPSIARRITRALGRFCVAVLIGVVGTLSWQFYGGEMVRAWAPSLGWLAPASPSAELQVQLKPVALDLAIMKRTVEQLAASQDQLARKQDQMTQAFATLQAAEQDIKQNILALAPLAPKAAHVPPSKASQAAAQ
jgi:uncharacterized iron-regulated membrane protein